jgi:probable HAF family extracellular repeat protein
VKAAYLTGLGVASLLVVAGCREDSARSEEADRPYTFTTLEYPGAEITVASDITDDGRIVGWYTTGGVTKGFVHADGKYTSIEHPGAIVTHVTGAGPDGSLVGSYRKEGEPNAARHGYLRRPSGEFVAVRHPAQPYTMAQRILNDGTIIGCYHGDDFRTDMRGMTISGSKIDVLDVPGSMTNGATPDGQKLVGLIAVGEGRTGFIAEGDRVTRLEAPGSTSTEAWDINATGVIVGATVDSAKVTRGFVLKDGRWTTLHPPASRSTVAFGINARGEIVGGWEDTLGRRRAYLAARR